MFDSKGLADLGWQILALPILRRVDFCFLTECRAGGFQIAMALPAILGSAMSEAPSICFFFVYAGVK